MVHADETGWREDGDNGYVWTFSTPTGRYFPRRNRSQAAVEEVLRNASGSPVSDFYVACHHYDGPKQRCWVHLLRDIHDLRSRYPDDEALAQWADAFHQLYCQAKASTPTREEQRHAARIALERRWVALCRPFLDDPSALPAKLCRRIQRHIKELFVFIAQPEVP